MGTAIFILPTARSTDMPLRSLFTAVIFLLFLPSLHATASVQYPDIPQTGTDIAQVAEYIGTLRDAGIIQGYPDETFGGEREVTRYEMGAVVTRLYGNLLDEMEAREIDVDQFVDVRLPVSGPLDVTDVPDTHWVLEELVRLEHMGVVSGFPDGEYKGYKTVTRDQFAVYLARTAVMLDFALWMGCTNYHGPISSAIADETFNPDIPESSWAIRDIQRLHSVEGGEIFPEQEYSGNRPMTRYAMAEILAKFRDLYINHIDEALNPAT
jgi:hypothetical protein